MTSTETTNIFINTTQCNQEHITQCNSARRIKSILNNFTTITITNVDKQKDSQCITRLMNNNYTNTNLLNDFDHIKYNHHADDDSQFEKMTSYFVDAKCNPETCKHIKSRSKEQSNKYTLQNNDDVLLKDECTMRLIGRIHVYFFHSYDINKFTSNEKQNIESDIKLGIDDEKNEIDDMTESINMTKMMNIIKTKKDKLNTP
eukprot:300368_1